MSDAVRVWWFTRGAKAKCPPDPDYPDGIDLDMSGGAERTCTVKLDYPARCCGTYYLVCEICGLNAAVTTAGRRDDPRSVTLPCKIKAKRSM